tara:strand:+ start:1236 stop:1535 length:300 start_codon:yes stop_codon:yes gene_type:complete
MSDGEPRPFDRTTAGLRDALMSEMEDIRAGVATPQEATAFAGLAEKVIRSLEADLQKERIDQEIEHKNYERKQLEEKKALKAERRARKNVKVLELAYEG